jgi:1,4-alpha-glucan branching enzyme
MTSVMPNGLVEFRFYRPDAQDVKVVGSFNGWGSRQLLALEPDPQNDGWWTAEAQIAPGEYHFRYKVNGAEWFTDFAANGVERNKHGWNSILIVPEQKARKIDSLKLVSDDGTQNTVTEAVAA